MLNKSDVDCVKIIIVNFKVILVNLKMIVLYWFMVYYVYLVFFCSMDINYSFVFW